MDSHYGVQASKDGKGKCGKSRQRLAVTEDDESKVIRAGSSWLTLKLLFSVIN